MGRKTRSRNPDAIYDVNMTPLIDVSLVLVVILMVATPMAFQSGIKVQNAASSGKKTAVLAKSERVEIEIITATDLVVNRNPVPATALKGLLPPLLDASATRTVVVRCADSVPHGAFVTVLDVAKACGAAQIAVVGG